MSTPATRTYAWIMLALATLVLATYARIIGHDFIDLDDLTYITLNPPVAKGLSLDGLRWAFTNTHAGNWHPLTWLSHMLDVSLFGLKPGGHHLVSLILHGANTLLLFHLLTTTTRAVWRSALVATLFAVHPLHVESVAWAAERKDLLSTLFFLLTLLSYTAYVRSRNIGRYLLTVLTFSAGLLAKSMLVSLPLILFLCDFWPLYRLSVSSTITCRTDLTVAWRRIILEKLPFIAISAAFCGITYYSQTVGNAVAQDTALSLGIRLQNGIISYAAYLRDMVWPSGLAPFYPLTIPISPVHTVMAGICLVLLSALVARYWRQYPYLLTGWLWYLITLVPVIGLVQVGLQSRADRYTYIPLIGIFTALVWAVGDLGARWRIPTRMLTGISCAVVITLSLLCFRQVGYWQNSRTLFTHTYAVTERNYMADMILGNSSFAQRDFPTAISHYQRALRGGANGGVIHLLETKLATCYGVQGLFDDAIYHYQLALQVNPQHANTYYLIGQLQETKGNDTEAIINFRRSIDLDPGQLDANLALAQVLQRRGDEHGALTAFHAVLRQQPENPDALFAVGVREARQGNSRGAADYFTRALRQRPTFIDAQRNLELLQRTPAN